MTLLHVKCFITVFLPSKGMLLDESIECFQQCEIELRKFFGIIECNLIF